MAKEIERKWLIDKYKNYVLAYSSIEQFIKQGYILVSPNSQLRIRFVDCKTYLCLKFTEDIVRDEYEYEIPLCDGLEMLKRCEWKVEKIRREYKSSPDETHTYDLYPNGLMVVEVEFKSKEEAEAFKTTFFFGEEITGNREYSNITLAKQNLHF